jgi:hypothetical protein
VVGLLEQAAQTDASLLELRSEATVLDRFPRNPIPPSAPALAKLPVVPVPARFRLQPIDAGEVVDRLVELALGTPAGLVPDIGGPRVYEMVELLRTYVPARRMHRLFVPVPIPGNAARRSRLGQTWPPTEPWAAGRGRTSWQRR